MPLREPGTLMVGVALLPATDHLPEKSVRTISDRRRSCSCSPPMVREGAPASSGKVRASDSSAGVEVAGVGDSGRAGGSVAIGGGSSGATGSGLATLASSARGITCGGVSQGARSHDLSVLGATTMMPPVPFRLTLLKSMPWRSCAAPSTRGDRVGRMRKKTRAPQAPRNPSYCMVSPPAHQSISRTESPQRCSRRAMANGGP